LRTFGGVCYCYMLSQSVMATHDARSIYIFLQLLRLRQLEWSALRLATELSTADWHLFGTMYLLLLSSRHGCIRGNPMQMGALRVVSRGCRRNSSSDVGLSCRIREYCDHISTDVRRRNQGAAVSLKCAPSSRTIFEKLRSHKPMPDGHLVADAKRNMTRVRRRSRMEARAIFSQKSNCTQKAPHP
jgi:hypothetical protein